ncbi:hypothetical protein DL767_002710 [Monosporascus sp. MG133]|nr:hypothetical protein DL767_002710 [Monosporascus sp. MG133]
MDPVTYAALSYCWGGEQVHKTTTENLPRYSLNVQWENLPKTIQDAVKVTAALGIEYLWVDSICIVQDDGDDKAREIAHMPSIYNGATVTIVAATAKAAKDGFLHDRDPHTLMGGAFSLPFRCPDGRIGSVYLSKIGNLEFDEHIDTRAWTLQEAYLSTRLLRFGNKQCSLTCQCSPSKPRIVDGWKLGQEYDVRHVENIIFLSTLNVEDDVPALKHFYKSTYGTDLEYDVDARETVHGDFIDMWRDLVEAYTTRSLSVPGDRCLAISGLADRIAPILKTRYVAGHWEKFLPADLLWRVETPQPKPRAYQGPSWSWTSVNGSVLFYKADRNVSLEVQKADTQLYSPKAPFGAVKQGTLRVRGKLLKACWTGRKACSLPGEAHKTPFSKSILSDMFWPDTQETSFLESSAGGLILEPGYGGSEAGKSTEKPTEPTQQVVIYFLEICSPGSRTGSGSIGLVLQERSPSSSPSGFSRIGLYDFTVYPNVGEPGGVSTKEWEEFVDRRNHYFDKLDPREIEIE